MRISIWGLGCPGLVLAASLAQQNHTVIGIDTNENQVAAINAGGCGSHEPGLSTLLSEVVKTQRLRAEKFRPDHAPDADVSFIVVGTPAGIEGELDTSQVEAVVGTLAGSLQRVSDFHLVVVRSTVPVGYTQSVLAPLLERRSGRSIGRDIGLVVSPEFLREGDALNDFHSASSCVVGAQEQQSADAAGVVFQTLGQTIVQMSFEEAEMLKLVTNAFHALKVGFANEVARLCTTTQIDAAKIMDVLCRDQHLNISPAYLRPGFAFSGACLAKDLAALTQQARATAVSVPITENILPSNEAHLRSCLAAIAATGYRAIGILGLTPKPSSDDLRNSAALKLIAHLQSAGYCVCAFDPNVQLGRLSDRNRLALETLVPNYHALISSTVEAVVAKSSLMVVTQTRPEFKSDRDVFTNTPMLDLANPNFSSFVGGPKAPPFV